MSNWIRSKSWLIKKLKELKRDLYSDNFEETIRNVENCIYYYENSTWDSSLDRYLNKFEPADYMMWYLEYRCKTFWFSQVARDLRKVKYDSDYYLIDDVYWTVYDIDEKDVEEWIDDILYDLK
jgi:hypothetical protein